MKRLMLALVVAGCVAGLPAAAQEPSPCDPLVYEDQNQIEPRPLKVKEVAGTAKDEGGFAVLHLCVTLYTEKDHQLVAVTRSGPDGRFAFSGVRPGRYRLLAASPGFCTANAPLRVASRGRTALVVTMKPGGIDTCSHVALQANRGARTGKGTCSGAAGLPRNLRSPYNVSPEFSATGRSSNW